MAAIAPPLPVKPVCAVTFAPGSDFDEIVSALETLIGKPDAFSPVYDFDFTDYYGPEMGPGLKKTFIGFETLVQPSALVRIKRDTNSLEARWSVGGRRSVNLDPGYVTSAKLVMASTKDFAHRVFLGEGIYGDVHLQFRHGKWRPSGWTFPDYRTRLAAAFFSSVRDKYNQQERQARHAIQ
jgi:hypothetical protein